MKFSTSILTAALVLGASSSTYAFSTQQSTLTRNNIGRSSSLGPLASSTEDKVETAAASSSTAATPANGLNDTAPGSRTPLTPEFQAVRDAAVGQLKLPNPALEKPLVHFMDEYFASLCTAAAAGAKNPDGSEITAQQAGKMMMTTLSYGVKYGLGAGPSGKFIFDVRHKAIRGGEAEEESLKAMLGDDVDVDFYAAGCDFFRPSMDLENSLVLGDDNMKKALEQINNGENVVFLANHQSEADPQVVSCLFEKVSEDCGDFASRVTYVAGHKVTTDPLAVPFSMGRNLLCIHSKKHIDADPETKPAKSKQNMSAMSSMLGGLKEGGMAIWVAPSGGRDRRDVETGKIPIAPFDQKTVDMFRLMGNKSKTPTHFYPMSMVSYDLCPPPDFVEAGVGEQRNVRYTPIGICIGDEVPNVGGAEKRHLFTEKAEEECMEGYTELLKGLGMESYIP
mmetsp:Transcript_3544/g.7742  ORF Transcript_3544/g.7742 Transcript_3544/m.7742 type:complete len:451 (+) Transcript_3544:163-1515(+)